MRRPGSGLAATLALPVLLAGLAWVAWPAGLGGRTSYVTTHGTSMRPGFHTGDLAVVRPAREYRVGDVVAYRSARLGSVVMHRVVEVEGDRYVLKGDGNAWLDPERPSRDQLVGRVSARVPQGGLWLRRVAGPWGLAAIVFTALATGGGAVQVKRRKRTMGKHSNHGLRSSAVLTSFSSAPRAAVAVTAAAGIALGAVTWTAPVVTETAGTRPVPRSVTFAYSASVPRTAAYDSTVVHAPDPVFRKVAQRVAVSYVYQGGAARVAVDAELSAPSGWRSTVPLAAQRSVDAGRHEASVDLDLAALADRARVAAEATGLPIDQTNVAVVARVTSVDGGATFAPALQLVLTPSQLRLADDQKALTVTDSPTAGTRVREAAKAGVLGTVVPVGTGRRWSVLLLASSLLAGFALLMRARRSGPPSEAARIGRRYGPLLLPVLPVALPEDRSVVDVAEFATLVKLAERYGLLVLHWCRADVTTYVVRDDSTTYRYRSVPAV